MAPVAKVKCPKCQTTFEKKGKRIEDYIPPGSVNLTRARYEAKGKLIGIASKEHQHHVVLLDIGPTTADGWGNSPLALEFLNSKQGRLFLPTFKKWLKDKQRTLNTTPADAPAEATATNQPMYKASGLMCGLYGIVDCTKPLIVERFVSYVNAKGCTHLKKNQKKNEKRQDVNLGGCSQHQDALMSAFMALSLNTALLLPLC